MVNGIGKNNQQNNILRLKNQDKTIDLTKLEGLRQTDKNKAIFEKFDINRDGKIDENEAKKMQEQLYKASGDGLMSKREMKKNFGDKSTFDALSYLADQQAAIKDGKEYVEQNGNKTSHIYKSDTISYRYDVSNVNGGDTYIKMEDGTTIYKDKQGISTEIKPDKTVICKDKQGKTLSTRDTAGNTTIFSADGNSSTTYNSKNELVSSIELKGDKEIRTEYEYKDNKRIAREYNGLGKDAELSSVTVSENRDGHCIETKYATEDDMKNNRPSEQITDAQNDTLKKVTTFTYDENGNVKAETTDSAGQKTVKYTNAKGEEIQPEAEDTPTKHTVQKGESITQIVTKYLAEQGFENPTPEEIKAARKEFLEANKDIVKTYNGPKAEYKGNKFFHPNDEVTIPKFTVYGEGTKVLDEVVVTAKAPTQEAKNEYAMLKELIGDEGEVTYNKEGQVEVLDKNGKPLAIEEIEKLTTDEQDAQKFMDMADTSKDKKLSLSEYREFIINSLVGDEINENNREAIYKLIDESFGSIDSITTDNELTKYELLTNNAVVSELANKINKHLDDKVKQQIPENDA